MSPNKPCPKCGNNMIFKKAAVGLPDRYVCTNCAHDEVVKSSITSEDKTKPGKRTLVD